MIYFNIEIEILFFEVLFWFRFAKGVLDGYLNNKN